MADEEKKPARATGIDLLKVYEWMHKDGDPDPSKNVNADTMLLMDIAMSLRTLVRLSYQSMEMNQAIMVQLNGGARDTTQDN